MEFKYNNYTILIQDDLIKYKIDDEDFNILTIHYLCKILYYSGDFQLFFNGYNLAVLRYIKYQLLPIYFNKNGLYIQDKYIIKGKNKNIYRRFF